MDWSAKPAALVLSLAETPARLEAAVRGLSADQLTVTPTPEAWSPNEVLWHIRATADVYGEHVHRIVSEDSPRWRHVSPRARMKKSRYDQVPFVESFAAFAQQRADLVDLLGSLAPEAWQRAALIRVRETETRLTLQERISVMAAHEAIHCRQVEATAAALR